MSALGRPCPFQLVPGVVAIALSMAGSWLAVLRQCSMDGQSTVGAVEPVMGSRVQ